MHAILESAPVVDRVASRLAVAMGVLGRWGLSPHDGIKGFGNKAAAGVCVSRIEYSVKLDALVVG